MSFSSKVRAGLLTVVVTVTLPIQAWAQSYMASDLGQLNGKTTFGLAINASGQITGYSLDGGFTQAFVSGAGGQGLTALSVPGYEGQSSYAQAINAAGQVAGYVHVGGQGSYDSRAFITGANGQTPSFVQTPEQMPYLYVSASAINDHGQVGGAEATAAFVTGPNGQNAQYVSIPYDASDGAWVTGINNAGQITGHFSGFVTAPRAYIAGPYGAGLTLLDLPQGAIGSEARGINGIGQVIGALIAPDLDYLGGGFVTGPNGQGVQVIDLLAGYEQHGVRSINAAGQMVGGASNTIEVNGQILLDSVATFIAGVGQAPVNLNTLVALPDGVTLSFAAGINDKGQIVANASNGHVFLLTPVPEPGSALLAVTGLFVAWWGARRRCARASGAA